MIRLGARVVIAGTGFGEGAGVGTGVGTGVDAGVVATRDAPPQPKQLILMTAASNNRIATALFLLCIAFLARSVLDQ